MLYCKRCQTVCDKHLHRCPNCKSNKLRPVAEEDFVFLTRADVYTAGRLESLLAQQDMECRLEPYGRGRPTPLYDSEVMPTDKSVFVPYRDLTEARELYLALAREMEEDAPDEEFQELPRRKRILVQAVSAAVFILLIIVAVFAADAVAGWLKGIFGLG